MTQTTDPEDARTLEEDLMSRLKWLAENYRTRRTTLLEDALPDVCGGCMCGCLCRTLTVGRSCSCAPVGREGVLCLVCEMAEALGAPPSFTPRTPSSPAEWVCWASGF